MRSFEDLPLAKLQVAVAGKVELAVLFGSMTTGHTHAESDVDIAVWPRVETDLDLLTGELMSACGTDAVDVSDLRRGGGTLQQIVATRGRLLFEEWPGRFAEFAALAERRWQDDWRRQPYYLQAVDRWLEARGV